MGIEFSWYSNRRFYLTALLSCFICHFICIWVAILVACLIQLFCKFIFYPQFILNIFLKVRGALETLLSALNPIEHTKGPKNEIQPALMNSDLLSREAGSISLLLSLLVRVPILISGKYVCHLSSLFC